MLQDRPQKKKALRYTVSKNWFPQLELNVSTYLTIGRESLNITDVDVFASIPDDFIGYRNFLIDCKTGPNESPIGRALWQIGLMERLRADRGMCILRKERIETDHRYTAAQLRITLLSENEFDEYARATSPRYDKPLGILADIDAWELFFSIPSRFKRLAPAINFSKSGYWMANDEAEACRKTLLLVRELRPELDPEKREHVAIVGDIAALFMHSLAIIVSKIFSGYLQPKRREDLSEALLLLLYGGRDSYEQRNRLKKMFAEHRGIETGGKDLSLPEWDRFVQLVRQALDAPFEVNKAPLILREIAWEYLTKSTEREFGQYLATLSPQGARFSVLGLDYICKASKLPPEFSQILGDELLSIQASKKNSLPR
jgi:hypothetical protein